MLNQNRARAAIFALLLASAAAPAFAQSADNAQRTPAPVTQGPTAPGTDPDETQTVIVTATKRAENILNVPFSVNAQTQVDIQRRGATNIEDISRNVASLTVQNLGPGQSQVAIRGVSAGQIVRDQPGVKEQVGIYLDESVISLSLFTPDIDLFDLARVETLRGPQGTLFGSGSVGGTVRYITNQPRTDKVEGTVEANVNAAYSGGIGGWGKAAFNLPLNDKIAVRAVGYYTRYGGFIDAITPTGIQHNVNDGYRAGGRIAVLLKPIENLTITPRVLYQEIETNGFNREEKFNLYGNPFTTTRPAVTFADRQQYLLLREKFRDKTLIADNTINWDLGPVALTSVSSYTHRDILVSRDASALTGSVSVDLGYQPAAFLLPSRLNDTTKVDSYTQEFRAASTGKGPFKWLVGAFYANTDRTYDQRLPTAGYEQYTVIRFGQATANAVLNGFPTDSPYNSHLPYNLEQIAIFGEGTINFTPELSLTGGARYYDFHEKRTFLSGGIFSNDDNRTDRTKSNGATPRVILQYKAAPEVTFNFQASEGFRLGGVNDPLNAGLCTASDRAIFGGYQSYKDETLWNYEAGVKAQTRHFTFNSAFFYTDIHDLQTTLDAGSCSSRVVFNVARAHTVGLEMELAFKPLRGLDISFSGDVLESRFDSTVKDGTGAVLGGIQAGNRLPSVPTLQLSANATYTVPISATANGFVSVTAQHVGDRYTQPSDQVGNPRSFVSGLPFGGATGQEATTLDLRLPAYQIVNLQVGAELQHGLSVTAYVNNLFDENALLSFDRERGGRARLGFAVGNPRTMGVTVRKAF